MIKKGYLGIASTLLLLGGLASFCAPAAVAEGSQDLVSSGGDRPYLEFRNDTNGGILRRTIVKVYAEQGETINLGSSAVGIGSGVINYRDPNNQPGSCNGDGLIANRNQEVAGPGDGSGNTFVPCKVTVGAGQTGIWEIDFVSPDPASGENPPAIGGNAAWTQSATSGIVSAWDVTVRADNTDTGTKREGRVYANYFAFNIGNNQRSLSSAFSILTREGYQYALDLNGLDPYGFILFANRNGFFEQSTGDSIFRSLQLVGPNPGQLPAGFGLQNPNDPDTGIYITHKTFINRPDPSMPSSANSPTGSTWLLNPPLPPPVPTGLEFTGIEGTPGQAGTNPLGGTLSFNSPTQSAFSITIDLNNDGDYGTGNDRTFLGRAVIGANTVFWDGLDGNQAPVPPSTIPYNVRVNLYGGEAHFPMIDAEQNPNGLILRRLNQPAGPTSVNEDPFNVYFDDRNRGGDFTLCASGGTTTNAGVANPACYGGASADRDPLTGINSSGGAHEFTNNFGDRRGIDTWVYYPSADVPLQGGIVIKEADLIVAKDVDLDIANPGDPLEYTITVTNDGPSDETGIGFQDVVPASLTNVSWTCSITEGNGSCGDASGSGNNINTSLNLDDQAEATYTVNGIISTSASGRITNSATVVRNNDITDPDLSNNTDDAVTVLNTTPPPSGTICYTVPDGNSDRLVVLDINSGAETDVGPVGVGNVEAIAYWPITDTLYAANANALGTLNRNTGAYSNIGSFGSGSGSVGNRNFNDVDGLAFHPFTGELYGSARQGGTDDLLIKIDPTTGARVPNAFGPGVDYLVIQTSATTGLPDIDDITFDPDTGFLYGLANSGGNSNDELVRINTTNGTTTSVGTFGVRDVEGLTAFNDGQFYAVTGNRSSNPDDNDSFYSVDKVTGQATLISNLSIGVDHESIACLTGPPNRITGNVFLDSDTSGTLNSGDSGTPNAEVRLYRDNNGNGQVDPSDTFLLPQNTAGDGTYDFLFASNGAFVLDVDPATLPPDNSVFTTDNVEEADFGTLLGITDSDNNFGHFTNSNLAIVKRITAINGSSLPDSVDDTNDDNDNHPNWPAGQTSAGISTFLAGATNQFAEPGDIVEYTVYYLATGNAPITNVKLCDRIPDGTTYVNDSMVLFTNSSTSNLSDTNTDGDGAEFLPIGDASPVPCPGTNDDGTVLVNLAPSPDQLPNATGPGTPTNAFGFIRFRVTVD